MTKEQKELCERIYAETGIDADYIAENNMPEDIDAFMEELEERVHEIECIYYSRAIEYLAEHDNSLTESLGLASEYGYKAKDLDSEKLATMLMQQNASEALAGFRDEIEEVFYPATA